MATFNMEMRISDKDLMRIPDEEWSDFWDNLGKVVQIVVRVQKEALNEADKNGIVGGERAAA